VIEDGEDESLCIPRPAFKRLVDEIIQDSQVAAKRRCLREDGMPETAVAAAVPKANSVTMGDEEDEEETAEPMITPEAVDALHVAAEQVLTQMMLGANRAALHAGRETIMPKDIQEYAYHTFTRVF
jgi:histone H3/H4